MISTQRSPAIFLALLLASAASVAEGQAIVEVTVPTPNGGPYGIASGPDGSLWFTEMLADRIGRISPQGAITEFALPAAGRGPARIAAGPDGNLWFTEYEAGQIGRISPAGAIAEFPIPTPASHPRGITAGPDGNVWFTESAGDRIGRITPAGAITEFPLPAGSRGPDGIMSGPDGRLWFTVFFSFQIGRATTAGAIDTIALSSQDRYPRGITTGPEGSPWLTEVPGSGGSSLARVLGDGSIEDVPAGSYSVWEITAGPDGNLWFTESDGTIGRVTLAGEITRFPIPSTGSNPQGIAVGPDGNLWFTEFGTDRIGRIAPAAAPPPTPDFSFFVSPASRSLAPGASATADVAVEASGGFNAAVALSLTGLPAAISANFSPASFPPPGTGSATLTISAGPAAAAGSYPLTVRASGAGVTHTTPFALTVSPPNPPPGGGSCVPDDTTMCLNGGRFQIVAAWQDHQGRTGVGHVVPAPGVSDSGLMWFFSPDNFELLVKVLDGCVVNGHTWVFAAASTDVAYTFTVTDLQTGAVRQYSNSLGTAAPAVTDTAAFADCP